MLRWWRRSDPITTEMASSSNYDIYCQWCIHIPKPSAPTLQGGTEGELLFLLALTWHLPQMIRWPWGTQASSENLEIPLFTRVWLELPTLLLFPWEKIVPCDDKSNEQMQYWPFAMSELSTWKNQNTSFSENPRPLNYILDSVIFTHQPPWDDGQKLLDSFYYRKKRDKSDRSLKIGCGIWW